MRGQERIWANSLRNERFEYFVTNNNSFERFASKHDRAHVSTGDAGVSRADFRPRPTSNVAKTRGPGRNEENRVARPMAVVPYERLRPTTVSAGDKTYGVGWG